MDALIFAVYIGSIAFAVAYLIYAVYDYLRFKKIWTVRSRCPGCGRLRCIRSWSCVYHVFIFECRKCGMTWMDMPPKNKG